LAKDANQGNNKLHRCTKLALAVYISITVIVSLQPVSSCGHLLNIVNVSLLV